MNRRAFLAIAHDALEYFKRYDRPLAVLVIDIDHFKTVNDTYGHVAGDAAICRVGELIEGTVRVTDKAARFGGEESSCCCAKSTRSRRATSPSACGLQSRTPKFPTVRA
jgi:diguanylate cyclase (GGDEF)-like protein